MNLYLKNNSQSINNNQKLVITGSKSETNRLLLLQALYPNIILKNTSNSDDSEVMLSAVNSNHQTTSNNQINIHHAGTAMRFLTAYFAQKVDYEVILTGSSRMQERPIAILVNALSQLGAIIEYMNQDGFPPLKIIGKKLSQSKISLPANVSSQYISALLLIAPKLENGLQLTLEGTITSVPYIKMTLSLLNELGIETSFEDNTIKVKSKPLIQDKIIIIESDWSSASYWYSIIAISEVGTQITLSSYKKNSLQGDSVLENIYQNFGVITTFNDDNTITILKNNLCQINHYNLSLDNAPDIAQTIAVTCFALKISCYLTGLHTLKIKETDRLLALKTELTKLGAAITITDNSLTLDACLSINANIEIATYQDHRMAMAFAPLALKTSIIICNADVVSKSYPTFWDDCKSVGFQAIKH